MSMNKCAKLLITERSNTQHYEGVENCIFTHTWVDALPLIKL